MQVICKLCHSPLRDKDIQVVRDMAKCWLCGEVFIFSQMIAETSQDLTFVPSGIDLREDTSSFSVVATLRSPLLYFLIPFGFLWVCGTMGGLYGVQFYRGKFDPIQTAFGIPFIFSSMAITSLCIFMTWGKCQLWIKGPEGRVFIGIGKLGFGEHFDWKSVKNISIRKISFGYPDNPEEIVMEGASRTCFASFLPQFKRRYLLNRIKKYWDKTHGEGLK